MFCRNCGAQLEDDAKFCSACGTAVNEEEQVKEEINMEELEKSSRSKLVAGLLGIFLGGYGVHNFYLGFTKTAVIQIIVTVVTCGAGSLWGLIEGIMILCDKITKDADGKTLQN